MSRPAGARAPAGPPEGLLVIFGVRGDLAKRLLVPALCNLRAGGRLGDGFAVIGVDHGDNDDEGIRHDLGAFLDTLTARADSPITASDAAAAWPWLAGRLTYLRGDFEDEATYAALAAAVAATGAADVLFHTATAPRFFPLIAEGLAKAGLVTEPEGGCRRLLVEKPFGEDLATARALNRRLAACLTESQIYRIDHFLGKDPVRNIMALRFANGVFEPLWNRLHIDSVQITAAETVGVEGRGAFYDRTGALRDMAPNHLCQLIGMIAMEPPNDVSAEAVRAERGRVIAAIRPTADRDVGANLAAGQYVAGLINGAATLAYRDSPRVDPDSVTETFVALRLWVDTWRWAGTPFYVRTGKAMSAHVTEIAVRFKSPPDTPYGGAGVGAMAGNELVLRIQPDESISLLVDVRRPGPDSTLERVSLDFPYQQHFGAHPATGYESLIHDALTGDQTLFGRAEDVEAGWKAVMPFLDRLREGVDVAPYAAGSDGPPSAAALLAADGRAWRPLSG